MKRKCNHPNCKSLAMMIIPFSSMGASDAYCRKHYNPYIQITKTEGGEQII